MSILEVLDVLGHLRGVVIPAPVEALLGKLDPGLPGPLPSDPVDIPTSGTIELSATAPLVLGASLRANASLDWAVHTVAGGAELRLMVAADTETTAIPLVFEATTTAVGTGAAARVKYAATATGLTLKVGGTVIVRLTSDGAAVRIAQLTVKPSTPDIALQGGFGLTLPAAFEIVEDAIGFDEFRLALPDVVPLLGSLPLKAALTGLRGARTLTVDVPPTGEDPRVSGTLAFQLPAGFSIADLVPTAVDVALELPVGTQPLGADGPVIGQAVRIRAALSRPPDDRAAVTVAVSAESDAVDGLVAGEGTGAPDVALGIAVALAPAIAARAGAAGPAVIGSLFGTALALGKYLADRGGWTLHGVTLEAAPLAGRLTVLLDLSGAVHLVPMELGVAQVTMADDRPMRVRWRGVTATLDLGAAGGLGNALDLDFRSARCDVVDPGGWRVETMSPLKDVLEVVGTRSGNGSTWVEVDLRFTLDLGPVKVSGATVRGTWESGEPYFGVRGFDASLNLPGVVAGGGSFELASQDKGIAIALWGTLIPLNVGGFLLFEMYPGGPGLPTRFEFAIGVDLPAPIPLGPTGLGLFGVAASFGANAAMKELGTADPLGELRAWPPWAKNELRTSAGDVTIGAGVVIGTAPDNGLAFSALGVLGLTVPDFALRIGVNAKLLQPTRARVAEVRAGGAAAETDGVTLAGGLSATGGAIDVGIEGTYLLRHVLEIRIPVAAHFPFRDPNWWLRAGSDRGLGSRADRAPGPIQAKVFPDLEPLEVGGWAFLMIAGNDIEDLAGTGVTPKGFAVAVGIGLSKTFGVEGVLWAKVSATLIAAIGTNPFMVWAKGRLSGEVGVGPFRLGVDATIEIQIGPDERLDFHFRVCAVVDLWFTTLEGCIEIGQIDPDAAPPVMPDADDWPWPEVVLADGLGRLLPSSSPLHPHTGAVDDPNGPAVPANWDAAPTVWPDAIPLLTFPIAPIPGAGTPSTAGTQNAGLSGAGTTRFRWTLTELTLQEVGREGAPVGLPVSLTRSAWQPPAGVDAATAAVSTARQLALLTRSRAITMVHAADGGANAPGDPLRGIAGLCGIRFEAGRAWTYGIDAQRVQGAASPDLWHVPRRSDGRFGFGGLSPVLGAHARGVPFRALPPVRTDDNWLSGSLDRPSGPWAWPDPLEVVLPLPGGELATETFLGGFRTRSPEAAARNPEVFTSTRYEIAFDEPAMAGDLLLRVRPLGFDADLGIDGFIDRARAGAIAIVEGGSVAAPVEIDGDRSPGAGPTDLIMRVSIPAGVTAVGLQWTISWAASVDILGLYALGASDNAAASAAEADRKAAIAGDAAGQQDSLSGTDPGSQRTMLKPGTLYRLAAQLQWERLTDDGTGTATPEEGEARTSAWFFRTAPAAQVIAGGAIWKGASAVALSDITLVIDRFDPHYLERYLDGYSLADHAEFVFTTDRPSAVFGAPHLRELAGSYERDVALLLFRSDREEPPRSAKPPFVGVWSKPRFPLVDVVSGAAERFGCPLPPRAVQATWPEDLLPSTPYELSVAFPNSGQDAERNTPHIRGITFTTSAFDGPRALVTSLGFTASAAPLDIEAATASGHLRVANFSPTLLSTGVIRGDDAFETGLAALELPPLRTGGPARSSILWSKNDGRWAFRGVLLEATEPLVRDDGTRMDLDGAAIGPDALTVRRLDRSATRVLLLADTPIEPDAARVLRLDVTDRGMSAAMRLIVAPLPPFADSAIVGRNRP
ncbi:MAG: hypothetical protein QM628_01855 [Propionicimonas sp.]